MTEDQFLKEANSLFKRLGGPANRDARIVQGLMRRWEESRARLNAERNSQIDYQTTLREWINDRPRF